MDEPLSNLDAKLRVQMRAEIAALQRELGVTTFYVTHDQVEAMTMGDRVAVIKDGVLQQVDTPQHLYDHPVNVFVAAFIGSPSMNLYEGTVALGDDGALVTLGSQALHIPRDVLDGHPDLTDYDGRRIIVGIRPENMEDASLLADHPADQTLEVTIELVEALGADILAHFDLDAPTVDSGDPDAEDAATGEVRTSVARFNPRSTASLGDQLTVAVQVERMKFFDYDSRLAL
jgi:multiple sugar transport system ATP-binding protein